MKILKPIVVTLSAILVLLILATIIAPPVAKNYIIKHSKEMIGRQINIDGLYANIFTGYSRITGFELLDTNDRERFVKFDTLAVKVSLFRLLANELRINRIRLVNPDIQIWQKGNDFNFSDLLQTPADTATLPLDTVVPATTDTTADDDPMAIAINNIAIVGGQLAYRDLIVGSEWDMNDLQLHIPGIYFSGQNTDIGLNLNFNEGGSLTTSMQYNLEAGNYNLHLQLNDFAIGNVLPYLQQSMNVGEVDGLLSADFTIEGNTAHASDITITGNTALRQFKLADNDKKNLLSAGELFIDIAALNPEKQQFRFNTVSLKDFNSCFDLYPQTNTLSQLLKTETGKDTLPSVENTEKTSPAPETQSPDFFVSRFAIDNATFTFNDHTLHQPFRFTLANIAIHASNLTLTDKNRIDVKSTLDNGGTVNLTWDGQLNDPSNQDINLQIKNLDLKQFTPYSLQYFGYPLSKGVLAFSSINDIRNNYLDARNNLDIYRCEVDKKRKDIKAEFNIPLRTALYIIKDVNDKIKMDLPVKGNIKSPSFSYKKIIIRTLTNLLVKVAVSPFSFIANSLGLSGDGFKDIPFEVYQADFTPEQFDRINQLATVIKAKPDMTLQLRQYYNPEQGRQTLAAFQARKAYYLHSHPEISDTTLQAIDYARIIEIDVKDPAFQAYITSFVPEELKTAELNRKILSLTPAEKLQEQIAFLAGMRDSKLKNYLLHQGLTEKNIRIDTVPADSLNNYQGKNRYTFQLTLDDDMSGMTLDTPDETEETNN